MPFQVGLLVRDRLLIEAAARAGARGKFRRMISLGTLGTWPTALRVVIRRIGSSTDDQGEKSTRISVSSELRTRDRAYFTS